jgi:hypothetical protein
MYGKWYDPYFYCHDSVISFCRCISDFFFLTFGCCSCCFIFVLLCRPGWQLLGSRYPPASAFQVAGITGTRHHAWLRYFFLQPELDSAKVSFCYLLPPCCELAVCHFYAGLYKCTVYS